MKGTLRVLITAFLAFQVLSKRVVLKDAVVLDGEEPAEEEMTTMVPGSPDNLGYALDIGMACTTISGLSGQCAKWSDCYSTLFEPQEDDEEQDILRIKNQVLAEMIFNSSGICGSEQADFSQAIREQVPICCADQDKVPPPLEDSQDVVELDSKVNRVQKSYMRLHREMEEVTQVDESVEGNEANETRIVQGSQANKGEFPWIVALMQNGRQFCGGSLIDSKTVVTAAHCVQQMSASQVRGLRVYAGDHNIYSSSDGPHQSKTARKIYYNKGFSMQHLHHDVALILLSSPVTMGSGVKAISIGAASPGSVATVAGWGQVREHGSQPATLRKANVKVWTHSACKSKYGSDAPGGIGQGMLCAGGSGPDSCRGDSGGPLSQNGQLIGLVSFGIGCGTYPGVYTRASQYSSWIERTKKLS